MIPSNCIRLLLSSALLLLFTGCTTLQPLLFWQGFDFEAQTLSVDELRRALICETPTEASRLQVFDSAEALRASAVAQLLQVDQLAQLTEDASYIVVEQGQRRTGGFSLEVRDDASVDEEGQLLLTADWIEPQPDRLQIQILTSLCVLLELPPMPYTSVTLQDGGGATRAAWQRQPD